VNKVRSLLTMLGVIIGVFAVVALISAVKAFEYYVADQFDAIGSNSLYIMPGKMSFSDDPYAALSANKFQPKHIETIDKYAGDYVSYLSGYYRLAKNAVYKTNDFDATIEGINHQGVDIYDLEISQGEFFTEADNYNKNRVAVISNKVEEELFPNKLAVGETIKLDAFSYRVIGVFDYEIIDFEKSIFIPETVVKNDFDMRKLQGIVANVKPNKDQDTAITAIELALLHDLKIDDFTIFSQTDMLEAFQNILNIISIGLAAIAGISLLVGGIGIMNIMLVSVTERTREIGLRKALGATSINIGQQFVLEAAVISVSGGIIGLAIAWGLILVVQKYVRVDIPLWSAFMAIGFSLFVGVGFGTYPAIKASKKDPIESLRFE
jgi:putative ABC transport system permease protein